MEKLSEAKPNHELFKEVKARERRIRRQELEAQNRRIEAAERITKLANEAEKKTGMDIIAKRLPETDKPHLASAFEYQKIDGFHQKPQGADLILQQMK